MKFNPDPTKQTREITFSCKKTGNTPVNSKATHKDLGMILDSKLSHENQF